MLYTLPQPKVRAAFAPVPVNQPREAAHWIIDSALKQASLKLAPNRQELSLEVLLSQPDFFNDFKYGLAKSIGQVLAAHDDRVTGVYVFDPTANPDLETGEELPVEPVIHLLAVVKIPSAALDAFIAGLDRALVQQVRSLPSSLLTSRTSLLDIVILTAEEVERGVGYASLLSSMFTPPLRVW